jgi:hypothetical protein
MLARISLANHLYIFIKKEPIVDNSKPVNRSMPPKTVVKYKSYQRQSLEHGSAN